MQENASQDLDDRTQLEPLKDMDVPKHDTHLNVWLSCKAPCISTASLVLGHHVLAFRLKWFMIPLRCGIIYALWANMLSIFLVAVWACAMNETSAVQQPGFKSPVVWKT